MSSPADQTVICNSCSQGNVPPQLAQLCPCCPAPTADPGVAPPGGFSAMPGGKDPGKFPEKVPVKKGMMPVKKEMMREQVERMKKLAGIKKKK